MDSEILLNKNSKIKCMHRAVARSENPGWHVVPVGDNVSPLVVIRLTNLPKSGEARAPRPPPLATGLMHKKRRK